MDVASLLTLLLLALALAVQPWSVLAGVLLVSSEGGVAKEVTYVAGWVLALTAVAIATIALYPQTPKVAAMLCRPDSPRPGQLSSWSCSSSWPRLESQPHCCCWYSVGMRPLRSIRGGESG